MDIIKSRKIKRIENMNVTQGTRGSFNLLNIHYFRLSIGCNTDDNRYFKQDVVVNSKTVLISDIHNIKKKNIFI